MSVEREVTITPSWVQRTFRAGKKVQASNPQQHEYSYKLTRLHFKINVSKLQGVSPTHLLPSFKSPPVIVYDMIILASPNHPNCNAQQEVQNLSNVFECLKANSQQEDIVAMSMCSQGPFLEDS